VVVSKKVARLSVTRHRIKRRVLAALRAIALPRAVIILPKPEAAALPYAEVREELAGLLSKLAASK
jgi:ribonuclease P protein component